MNLDKTFCASDCKNYKCKDMLSMGKVFAAEKRKVQIKHEDKSKNCDKYKASE